MPGDPGTAGPDVDALLLLQNLTGEQPYSTRKAALIKLGELETSNLEIVRELLAVTESDPNVKIRRLAADLLASPVQQEVLQRRPQLLEAATAQIEAHAVDEQEAQASAVLGGETMKRKKPRSWGLSVLIILGVTAGAIVGIWLMTSVSIGGNLGQVVVGVTLALLIALIQRLYQVVWPGSPSNLFRRSHQSATADVVWVRVKRDRYDRITQHYVTVEFDTDRGRVRLEAPVGEQIHQRCTEASEIEVQYATLDPSVALLKGERLA